MRKIAIVNQKGGCGKSTTAVNLGAALGLRGKKVLLLDLDGQRNSTHWCGVQEPTERDLIDYLMAQEDPAGLAVASTIQNVEVVPASHELYNCEVRMTGAMAELRLRTSMRKWPHDRWDYVLMDCPADFKTLTLSALLASTDVLVVSKPGGMDIEGMHELFVQIDRASTALKDVGVTPMSVLGILLCQVNPQTRAAKTCAEYIASTYPGLLFNTQIRNSTRFLECPTWHESICTFAPGTAGDQDYRALAEEVVARTGGERE